MSKPDWKDAPEWAKVMVQQSGPDEVVYCWAAGFYDDAQALWSGDPAHMEFNLFTCCWVVTEYRP